MPSTRARGDAAWKAFQLFFKVWIMVTLVGYTAIFILAGLSKISGYEGNLAYMASVGVPGFLLPAVIALEVLGGVALVVGFQTRLVATALAIFSIASGLLFHFDLADQMQFIMFFKNLAMAGGLLAIANQRPGPFTIDRKLGA